MIKLERLRGFKNWAHPRPGWMVLIEAIYGQNSFLFTLENHVSMPAKRFYLHCFPIDLKYGMTLAIPPEGSWEGGGWGTLLFDLDGDVTLYRVRFLASLP